ncbi:MAG: peptidase S8 [Alphaproteobacteria bacterium]|nr:peptidase S8 [Alphaproteobacteria bacterium]MCB9692732.1 peptidase S8 [Alphaproteobacteria bacterium]
MAHTVRNSLALAAIVGGVYALAPSAPERHLPEVPAVTAPDASGVLVVDLVDGASEADLESIERILHADLDWTSPHSIDEALAQGQVADLDDALAALRGNPLVEVAEPMMQMSIPAEAIAIHGGGEAAGAFPNDPMYARQWNMKAMGAPEAWAAGAMGDGVIVAVVDTGVSKIEDLEGTRLLEGASFVPGAKTAADDQGHGSHVAGTIAQTTNNGKGVAGVAPNATILPVKVLSKFGFGNSAWIASGIDYAVDNGAQVINLSLGGGYSAVIHNAIKKAEKKGVVVVAAAGNSGRKGVGYPGALAETIGVSATGPDGKLAPYSSWGKGVDISAPGGDKRVSNGGILQDTVDGKGGHHYVEYQGTSMATPHVAGAAAVLLSRGVPAARVRDTLLESARGSGTWDEKYGHGQLDLAAALGQTTRSSSSPVPFLLGGIFAFLLAQMAGTSGAFRAKSTLAGALAGGGLFFLGALGLPDLMVVRLLSTGLVHWPEILFGGGWMHFPLWLSAALPMGLAFTLGAYHKTRPVALGVAAAFAATLFHGAATGALAPWWMPVMLGQAWLAMNATFSVLLGMGMAGTEILEQMERRR